MQIKSAILLGSLLIGSVFSVTAKESLPVKDEKLKTPQIDLSLLKKSIHGVEIKSVKPSPIDGLYQVQIANNIYYLSKDGSKLIDGAMIDLKGQKNLTSVAKRSIVSDAITSISDQDVITYAAKDPKYTVYVFTDISCPYCQKLHAEIPSYNKEGITVKYLAYPRNGLGTEIASEMQSIWCATDKKDAMHRVKINHEKVNNTCAGTQVRDQYELGRSLNLSGTPAIVLPNGDIQPGYADASSLIQILDSIGARQEPKL